MDGGNVPIAAFGSRARAAATYTGVGKIVYFADPDGFWVELMERPGNLEGPR